MLIKWTMWSLQRRVGATRTATLQQSTRFRATGGRLRRKHGPLSRIDVDQRNNIPV